MKPKKTDTIPEGDNYIYEFKYDGNSAIIIKKGFYIGIYHSNNGTNQIYKYPEVVPDLSRLKDGTYIAELIVATDNDGGSIDLIQKRQCENHFKILQRASKYPLTIMTYDIVNDGYQTVTGNSLLDRKKLLEKRIPNDMQHIKLVPSYSSPLEIIKHKDYVEGVVTKDINTPYTFFKRGGWYKFRFNKEEVVKFVKYEEWEEENGKLKGVVLFTEKGFKVNLPGDRRLEAVEKMKDNGHVKCEVSYYSKSDKGFRFAVIKRVLND